MKYIIGNFDEMKNIFKYIVILIYGTLVLYLANEFMDLNNISKSNIIYNSGVIFLLIAGYIVINNFFEYKYNKKS